MAKISLENTNTANVMELYQYDYGQILEIEGLSLPEQFEVHFQNGSGVPVTVTGTYSSESGIGSVPIPDECLQQDFNSFDAWLWVENEKSGKTLKTITFYLNKREKPEGVPPISSVSEIKGYADHVKENAEKVTAAEQTASELKELAEKLNEAGYLKMFIADSVESINSWLENMYNDFLSNVPVFFMSMVDDAESGFKNGEGYIIADSGTGSLEDAVFIPICYSELPFTYTVYEELKNNFANNYGVNRLLKPLTIPAAASDGYVCINQIGGQSFSDFKPYRFSISVNTHPGQSTYKIAFDLTSRAVTIDLSPAASDTSETTLIIEAEYINRSVLLKTSISSDKGFSYTAETKPLIGDFISALYLEKSSGTTINYAYGGR